MIDEKVLTKQTVEEGLLPEPNFPPSQSRVSVRFHDDTKTEALRGFWTTALEMDGDGTLLFDGELPATPDGDTYTVIGVTGATGPGSDLHWTIDEEIDSQDLVVRFHGRR